MGALCRIFLNVIVGLFQSTLNSNGLMTFKQAEPGIKDSFVLKFVTTG